MNRLGIELNCKQPFVHESFDQAKASGTAKSFHSMSEMMTVHSRPANKLAGKYGLRPDIGLQFILTSWYYPHLITINEAQIPMAILVLPLMLNYWSDPYGGSTFTIFHERHNNWNVLLELRFHIRFRPRHFIRRPWLPHWI